MLNGSIIAGSAKKEQRCLMNKRPAPRGNAGIAAKLDMKGRSTKNKG